MDRSGKLLSKFILVVEVFMLSKLSFSREQMKWFAFVSMVIDHAACAFLAENSFLYIVCRYVIGRMAYPIFCVLFIEGFLYTKHPFKHIRDLFIFGLLTEPFFNMALYHKWYYPDHQNVLFSWCLGFFCLFVLEKIYHHFSDFNDKCKIVYCIVVLIFGTIAGIFHLDYDFVGIFCIVIGYLLKRVYNMSLICVITGVAIVDTLFYGTPGALLSIFPFLLYKGSDKKTGIYNKYLFYAAYPVHLMIFAFIVFK